MKLQLPALVMPLSAVSGSAQDGSTLQRRVTLSDSGCGAGQDPAAKPAVYAGGFRRYRPHTSLNARIKKKRFG